MSVKELQEYTFKSKYAAWIPEKRRRETWGEATDRFCDMFVEKYNNIPEVFPYIEKIRKAIKKKRVLGSQRGLQFGGSPILKRNARMYNCCFSYVDRPKFFEECMYLLMCGCGTGFSVQKEHIAKLPNIVKPTGKRTYIIPDSVEGWSDAIGQIVCSYFEGYDNTAVEFDYSLISPKGTRLNSCSGKAPGPEPLRKAIEYIRDILNGAINDSYRRNRLKSIEIYDIIMFFSDAVISGGVRRSATICLFSKDDLEMRYAKTGNWFNENPQRGRSNNSVVLIKNETSFEEFQEIMKSVREFGEPGFVWAESIEHGVNPCVEISFYAYLLSTMESGWQGCNLSTMNGGKIKTAMDFYRGCYEAAILGTLQAGFTTFPYLGSVSEEIFKQEALLGVSITGIMENPDICLNEEIQRRGAEIVKRTNRKIAKIIGINPAARTTCVKPEGTASSVLGTSSGVHPHHAKRYIRRVQANKTENVYQHFKKYNPLSCEASVWSSNDTDDVIAFTIEVPNGSKLKNQLSAIDLLKAVLSTQQNWVTYGKNPELCSQPWLNHNVSNTISVQLNEWEEVIQFIYDNRKDFCGVSLLPSSGDKDYPQAPFTEIFLPTEIVSMYGDAALYASGLIVEAKRLFDKGLWDACDYIMGVNGKVRGTAKKEWIDRANNYAIKYLDGDIKQLTYCLKDVDNLKLYTDLKREFVSVDYNILTEEENNVVPENEIACSGGKCEI